ncbi:hypothetical protein [Variovorax sp. CF079]|uniref:hypothetical protein n=1 Tax=Variovorax sp. CF079 TaxID=1882774 RepID=UPI00147BDF28|nr:hypothetical protein [Variovorax sp. CF079]
MSGSVSSAVTALVFVNALLWRTLIAMAFSHRKIQVAYIRNRRLLNRVTGALAVLLPLGSNLRPALGQLGDVAGPRRDVPLQVVAFDAALRSAIAGVGPFSFFLTVQQIGYLLNVCLIGWRANWPLLRRKGNRRPG